MFEITKDGKGTALYFNDKKDALMFCLSKMVKSGAVINLYDYAHNWGVQEVQHGT